MSYLCLLGLGLILGLNPYALVPPEPPLVPQVVPYRDYRGLEGARGTPYSFGTTLLVSVSDSVLRFRFPYQIPFSVSVSDTVLGFVSDAVLE